MWKYIQRGNADIVEEFAHISKLKVNKKMKIEEFAHISNLQVNKKTEIGDRIGLSTFYYLTEKWCKSISRGQKSVS